MKTVMVTGVGGGVGQSVLKALSGGPYRVVGVDSEPLAAGLHAVDKAYLGVYASNPAFVDRLLDICAKECCKLIFAGHDVEILPMAENASRFQAQGVTAVVSSPDVIRICDDKLATNAFLKANGYAVPETWRLAEVTTIKGPVVLKPQCGGARSRNTYVVRSTKEFDVYRRLVEADNCIVQEYIEGDEYTCGSVSLGGTCAGVIVMRRVLRDGDTYKAFAVRDAKLESHVRAIVEALKPFGACNVQLRVRDGIPYVFEINARCSGTTAARALAGFNEPRMIADYLLEGHPPVFHVREVSILRYWNELVVDNARIAQLRDSGVLQGNGVVL
ncbi:MAG: ATP-grasp domain-containing protein [Kiritimatiellae bacterium]|nr:ATP-grasp domain-containing protein [Kiritimatiellia bacterium]